MPAPRKSVCVYCGSRSGARAAYADAAGSRFELFGMANNKFEGFLCKAFEFGKGADLFTFAQTAACIRTKITEVLFIELNNPHTFGKSLSLADATRTAILDMASARSPLGKSTWMGGA